MSKITIEDISRHTGLSRGTVSRALNNRPDISAQTKQRVLDACRQLNYVPSHAARSLATGRCYAVAVVVDDLRGAFAGCFLRGVLGRAQADRYAVYVSELGPDPQGTIDHLCTVAGERVDSILLAAPLPPDLSRQLARAIESRPLVACGNLDGITCDTFLPDHTEAGRLIARHAIRQPAANVIYVHEAGNEATAQRVAGFREVCAEHNLPLDQVTIAIPSSGPTRLEAVRPRLASAHAVAADNDFLALELMLLCREVGRAPGRDIAIIGQGNELLGTRISPSLTTIDLCAEEIGRRAMEVAIQRATKTRHDAPQQTLVTPTLITRDSTRLP